MKIIENLRINLDKIKYPNEIKSIASLHKYSDGEGFFPGFSGKFEKDNNNENYKILVLGQDLDKVNNFVESSKTGHEKGNSTFNNLKILLESANIDLSSCFLSNILMGVRNTPKNSGESPGLQSIDYIKSCLDYLEFQIETLKPRSIITLGKVPFKLLTLYDHKLHQKLNLADNLKTIDKFTNGIIQDFRFKRNPDLKINLVFLTHPSRYHANIRHRNNDKINGKELELNNLKKLAKTEKR